MRCKSGDFTFNDLLPLTFKPKHSVYIFSKYSLLVSFTNLWLRCRWLRRCDVTGSPRTAQKSDWLRPARQSR